MSEEMTETIVADSTPAEVAEIEESRPDVATPTSLSELKPKMKLTGAVQRLELYGAFIDVGVGVNALIHISQLGESNVNRVSDVLNVGDQVTVWVDKVDPARQQLMVTMVEPLAVEWGDLKVGHSYTGTVTRLENFGAFINIGAEREGLVHISELSHDYVKSPGEVLKVGDEVQAQVLGFNKRKRRIDLSIKALLEKPEAQYAMPAPTQQVEAYTEEELEEDGTLPTAMELALRRAMGDEQIDSLATAGKRGKKQDGRNKRRRRDKMRQREDIYSRTLEYERD
jgi:small subunit ribosomal protein S1